jgi:hypothetical protein
VRTPFRAGGASLPPGPPDPRDGASTERYPISKVRPTSQLMARGGLLAAVAIGCLGGLVGLLRSPGDGGSDVPPPSGDPDILPGSVAGVAERAVEAWLTAAPGDDADVDALFVEPPAPVGQARDAEPLTVEDATAVAGDRLEDGYWTVIVAVDVVDPPPEAAPDDQARAEAEATAAAVGEAPTPDDEAAGRSTWYVEIGIVGNDAGGLAALTTPGVLPGPIDLETGWKRDGPVASEPEPDDPLAAMVDSFLNALLAGKGDPAPYLASGVDIPMAATPPFADVTVDGLSVVELDNGELRVWVEATATTPSDSELSVAYELVVRPRAERFDVLELWGSPTVTGSPNPPSSDDGGSSDGDGGGSSGGGSEVNDTNPATTGGDEGTTPATSADTAPDTTLAPEPGA